MKRQCQTGSLTGQGEQVRHQPVETHPASKHLLAIEDAKPDHRLVELQSGVVASEHPPALEAAVGTKANKNKSKAVKKTPLQLRADQLAVPNAVFKQVDGEEIGQIASAQIKPGCKGVALANVAEVLPYFNLQEPGSPHGVALMILEHDDPRLPQNHKVIKVPVLCRETQDPLIIRVAVVQLGQQEVVRNLPTHTHHRGARSAKQSHPGCCFSGSIRWSVVRLCQKPSPMSDEAGALLCSSANRGH